MTSSGEEAPPLITIDARMLYSSGIGVYLQNLLPRVVASADWRFALLGQPKEFVRQPWTSHPRVRLIPVSSSIYSLWQQFELPSLIPRGTSLYWSPHYDVPLLRRGKLLVTIHDVAHVAMPQIFSGVRKQAYAKTMLEFVRRYAAQIMFDSEFSRREFKTLVGGPAGPTSVVHIGLEESWRDPVWRTLPRLREKPYIIYVGNVKPHKNLGGLLTAFDHLRNRVDHDLVLIGRVDGFLTGDSAVTERLRKVDRRIVLAGQLSDAEVRTYVAQADALILPSFYEGFGLTPLEAMACGCPVAAARAASIPEICGDAPIYFDPSNPVDMAQAILSILLDQATADALRSKGRIQAEKYCWDDCAKKVVSIIGNLLP